MGINFRVTLDGAVKINWPRTDRQIIELGNAYVRYEQQLPPHKRVSAPPLIVVETFLQKAVDMAEQVACNEEERANATRSYNNTLMEAKPKLKGVFLHLRNKYVDDLCRLEDWGLEVEVVDNGEVLKKPRSHRQWAYFFERYIRQEKGLPFEAQIHDPRLTDMVDLLDRLKGQEQIRLNAQTRREMSVRHRRNASQALSNVLKICLATIVYSQIGGLANESLQAWGFDVYSTEEVPAFDWEADLQEMM